MAEKKACGRHVELTSNEAVRITQCPCGTLHVTLPNNGVTVRMPESALKNLTRGLMVALDKIEEQTQASVN